MPEFLVAVLAMGTVVFAVSAISKLRGRAAYGEFRSALGATRLIPVRLAGGAALAVAAAETACAAGLLAAAVAAITATAGWPAIAALASAAALTAALVAGVAVTIQRGITVRCRCFGTASALPLGLPHLVRNVALLALLMTGLACGLLDPVRPAPGGPALAALCGSALAALCGAVIAALFIRWDDLVTLLMPAAHAHPARTHR